MRYRINEAGNPMVVATPAEVHALRPAIHACFRRWRANEGDIEDFAQDVEIVVWQALDEGRVPGRALMKPQDALLDYMFAVAWNVWRNHGRKRSTRSEVLCNELPDMAGLDPVGRIDARETLQRISTRPDIVRVLMLAVNEVPTVERYEGKSKSTYGYHLTNARKWAKDVDAGRWQAPRQPVPMTPWKRKKKR